MATYNKVSINLIKAKEAIRQAEMSGLKYMDVVVGVDDKATNYGSNVVMSVSVLKEDYKAGLRGEVLGWGRTFKSTNNEFIPPYKSRNNG